MEKDKKTINPQEDDDLPPLEDFSEDLKKINKAKGTDDNKPVPIKVNVVESKTDEKPREFGLGFKKGFFSQQKPTTSSNLDKKQQNNSDQVTDLRNIKAKNKYEIDEVQNNMKSDNSSNSKFLINNIMGKKDQWLNEELFMKLAKNPKLLQAFTHPRFNDVMTLLQNDPAEAKARFGNSPEFNEFFKEFSGLMAEHFQKIGEKETSEFLNKKKEQDSEVEKIMSEKKIKDCLEKIQKEGRLDPTTLSNDQDLLIKINTLIKKGVLKTEPMK